MTVLPSAPHKAPWNPSPRPPVAPKRCSGIHIPSLAVDDEDGVQRMSELSDAVERRSGSCPAVGGDQCTLVRPPSCPTSRASKVTLYRRGLPHQPNLRKQQTGLTLHPTLPRGHEPWSRSVHFLQLHPPASSRIHPAYPVHHPWLIPHFPSFVQRPGLYAIIEHNCPATPKLATGRLMILQMKGTR